MYSGSGHESWIALVVFGGMFAVRYVSMQRRGGRRRGQSSANFFTGPGDPRPPEGTGATDRTDGTTFTGTAPGWFRDPFFKHDQRFWSGTEWTEHVTNDGVPSADPPPDRGGARA
ncbi:MAG: DUF2510 domain-containing protein [Acidimicrobiales bacterium]|jgi:hypothetical protein